MAVKRWFLAGMVVTLAAAGACGGTAIAPSGKLRLATAFYPLEFASRRVGGALVQVSNLTPPGGEPHDLELKPSDVRLLRAADVVFYFADGFQPAVENAVAALPDKSKAVDLLAGLSLKAPTGEVEKGLTVDPHVWLSPPLMQRIVDAITDSLVRKLASHAEEIRARAASLARDLTAIDREYKSRLSHCVRHEIFTSHAAFAYLAERYGLRQIAITGLSPESEPSSRRLREIARLARQDKATTIFFETLVSPRVSQAVARIVGARTAVLDPIEGLTSEEAAMGADYFSIMRSNLATLSGALGCTT